MFTKSEWSQLKDLPIPQTTLIRILSRVLDLGGKLLREPDKKLLTSMWLFLRTDGRALERFRRDVALKPFKAQHKKVFRDIDCELLQDLGDSPTHMVQKYPDFCRKIYTNPDDPPDFIPQEDANEIGFLDSFVWECHSIPSEETLRKK